MLHVPETRVERARFPVIDVHTHLTFRARSAGGVGQGEAMRVIATPPDLLPVMDRRNVQTMVNLTGGVGSGLQESVRTFQSHPTRFVVFTEPSWYRITEPGIRAVAGRRVGSRKGGRRARRQGPEDAGPLSPRAGDLRAARENRRPAFRSHVGGVRRAGPARGDSHLRPGSVLPSDRSLQRAVRGAARASRLVVSWQGLPVKRRAHRGARPGDRAAPRRRHSSGCTSATAPRTWRRYQPRSTGSRTSTWRSARASASWAASLATRAASSNGTRTVCCSAPTRFRTGGRRRSRFSATTCTRSISGFSRPRTRYFDYAPAKVPPQGRWRIYGVGLPEQILRKVYNENARRLLRL